jgi:hypothetical protein
VILYICFSLKYLFASTMRKSFFVFGFLGLLFTACKNKTVTFSEVVQNSSSKAVWVYFHDTGDSTNLVTYAQDSVLVPAHSETIIFQRSTLGSIEQFKPCKIYADSLSTRADSTIYTVTKNLNDLNNYQFNDLGSSKKEGKQCECRVVIKSTDVQ